MSKKTEIIIYSVAGVLIVIAAIVGIYLNSDYSKAASMKSSAEKYADNIKKSEMKEYKIINIDKYLELYKNDKASVVVIGRSGCEFCQIADPILKNISYKYDFTIDYLSLDEFDSDASSKLLNSDEYFKEKGGVETPLLLIVKKSSIVDYYEGLNDYDGYVEILKNNKIIK